MKKNQRNEVIVSAWFDQRHKAIFDTIRTDAGLNESQTVKRLLYPILEDYDRRVREARKSVSAEILHVDHVQQSLYNEEMRI